MRPDIWLMIGINAAVVGFVIALILLGRYLQRRRRRALEAFALNQGFEFTPTLPLDTFGPVATLPLFSRGDSRKAKNALKAGAHLNHLLLVDYSYVIGGGKSRRRIRQTVAVIRLPDAVQLPMFALRRPRTFDRLGALFGNQDINFEDHPEFSKRFVLRGEDETAVRRLFTAERIRMLEESRTLSLGGAENSLVAYRVGRCVAPDRLPMFLDEVAALRKSFARTSSPG